MASTRERAGRFAGLYRDAEGKQKSAGTYATAEEALAHAVIAEKTAHPADAEILYPETKRGKVTVAGYFPGWLRDHRLEATSRESYGALGGKHIVPALGTVAVADLDAKTVKRFLRKLEAGKLSTASVGHVRTVLRSLCRSAVSEGILASFPPDDAWKISPVRNREMMIATPAQASEIQRVIPNYYALLVETLFQTGMRYGEAMGLGPEHISVNPDYAVLRIGRRVITEVGGQPVAKNYGKSSNASRDVEIERDLGERLIANARGGWIFRSKRGGYLSRSNFRRVWQPACEAAGVPALRVHDARHSHASWLANDPEVPLAAVRDRLGHASLAVTSRYVHSTTSPRTILAALGRAA